MLGEITITTTGAPKIRQREVNKVKTDGMAAAAESWDEHVAPQKFTPAGARRYNFRRRFTKDIYAGRPKLRPKSGKPRAPSGKPLHWSGRSEQLSKQPRIRATKNRSRVSYPIRIFNFGKRHPVNPLPMSDEFRATLPSDVRRARHAAIRKVRAGFRRLKRRVVVRIT